LVCEQVHEYRPKGREPVAEIPPPTAGYLLITLAQTENGKKDLGRLYRLLDIIKKYPGPNDVRLAIATPEGLVNLEMSNVTADYCPELQQQLTELVGEEGQLRFTPGFSNQP